MIDAPDVSAPEVQGGIDRLLVALEADDWFGEETIETNDAGDLALVSVLLNGDPDIDDAHDAVIRLRSDYIPSAFAVVEANGRGGGAARRTGASGWRPGSSSRLSATRWRRRRFPTTASRSC